MFGRSSPFISWLILFSNIKKQFLKIGIIKRKMNAHKIRVAQSLNPEIFGSGPGDALLLTFLPIAYIAGWTILQNNDITGNNSIDYGLRKFRKFPKDFENVGNFSPRTNQKASAHGPTFCYVDPSCGPKSPEFWPGTCQSGGLQSPIHLDFEDVSSFEQVNVSPFATPVDNFFLQNNGHTLTVTPQKGDQPVTFFEEGNGLLQKRYILHNIHFHWGPNNSVGSEHVVNGKFYPLEAHFVHYDADFESLEEALGSGRSDALAVVAFFFDDEVSSQGFLFSKMLSTITGNIPKVADHHEVVEINEELDLSEIIPRFGVHKFFSYDGSLTTPGCQEQVKWFVFVTPLTISPDEMGMFRTVLDSNKIPLTENFRPIQERNGRKLKLKYFDVRG